MYICRNIKWYLTVDVEYSRDITEGETNTTARFGTLPEVLLNIHDIDQQITGIGSYLNRQHEAFTPMGSGWKFSGIKKIGVHVATYEAIYASTHIPTPTFLAKSGAVINVQNSDNKCFAYSILASLRPARQSTYRVNNYAPYLSELNMENIEYPVKIDQIGLFEEQNMDISVNVFAFDGEELVSLYQTKHRGRSQHINLLMISEGDKRHYVLIKDLRRLLYSKTNNKCYPCKYCLHRCSTLKVLQQHYVEGCRSKEITSFFPTPSFIAETKAILNIKCNDQKSFLYSILAAMHPANKNGERVTNYTKYMDEVNMNGIEYPVTIKQIEKFERQNEDISIGVMYFDSDKHLIVPAYCTKYRERKHHVNLFLLRKVDEKGTVTEHYTLVRNLDRLLYHVTMRQCYVCHYCLHRFSSMRILKEHIENCGKHEACRITFPSSVVKKSKDKKSSKLDGIDVLLDTDSDIVNNKNDAAENILKFKNFKSSHPVEFVIYADFESFLKRGESNGNELDKHIPSGFCTLTVSTNAEYKSDAFVYSGDDVMSNFFDHLTKEDEKIGKILKTNTPMMKLTWKEKKSFDRAKKCKSCKEAFGVKYRHHHHITGKYIGALCNRCNLQMKVRRKKNILKKNDGNSCSGDDFFIPVILHNS